MNISQELGYIRIKGLKNPSKEMDRYSLPNPEYVQAARSNRFRGNIPAKVYFAKVDGNDLLVPIPCYVKYDSFDLKVEVINHGHSKKVTLRDYQLMAEDTWLRKNHGILQACAGSGKTVLGCRAIEKQSVRSIVIVPTADILEQWTTTARDLFEFEFSRLGGTHKEATPESNAVVATFQSAIKRPDILANMGLIIIDEAHRSACLTIRDILALCPARYRYGVTATPWRADSLHMCFNWLLGGITAVVERADIKHHLVDPRIEIKQTGEEITAGLIKARFGKRGGMDMVQYQNNVADNEARNLLVAKEIQAKVKEGHQVLCLSQRVEQLSVIKNLLRDVGQPVMVHGSMKKPIREACMKALRRQSSMVLLATYNLAGEGLDIPSLSCLVYAAPNGNPTRTEQSCGRIARPFEGKLPPVVVDFVDKDPKSRNYLKNRVKIYKSLGYETEEV